MSKIFFWIIIVLAVVCAIVSLTLGHLTNFYNPQIKANLYGFIASLLAVVMAILVYANQAKMYLQKSRLPVMVVTALIGILSLIFQFALGFYFGAWGCIIWLMVAIWGALTHQTQNKAHLNTTVNSIKEQMIKDTTKINLHLDSPSITETLVQKPTCCSKCATCCYFTCLIITLLFMTLLACVSIVYFANWQQYGIYGQLIVVKSQSNDWTFKVHAYCIGQLQATRPTIVLQHGGGSNSIAFLQLGNILAQNNWTLCSYDRLGYGRSSIIPRYLTTEERAYITNSVITELLKSQPNQNIIIGGWSAGVQISQIYAKIYPQNVKGMIFLDGYPDYLTLDAICKNLSQPLPSPAEASSELLRFLSPFGADLVVGSNQSPNSTVSSYYRAYYQTGYFWQSQYFDLANPFTTATQWLTQNAGNSSIPYPNSSISLNWPDISVPLLVMPANQTVYGGQQCGTMYLTQCQKFLAKCTNSNKLLQIMPGKHDFVMDSPDSVANQINSFFSPLF